MFFHRLKIELRENRIYTLLWILVLVTLTISIITIWNSALVLDEGTGRPRNSSSDLIDLLILPLVILPIISTITSFRQDNLKDPRAFWNTRPIRPTTLHRTKFVFLHLTFTLPLALCTFIISINATSMGTSLLYAAESALWCAAAIHLCALCALHNHQWARLLIIPAVGLFGFILVAFITTQLNLFDPKIYNHPSQFSANSLFITLSLLFLSAIAGAYLIKKPGTTSPVWAPFLIGALTFPLLSANWLPNFSQPTESQKYQPSEPLTTFSNSSSSINRQYFYDLNYPLTDLMGSRDHIPISLVSQQIDTTPLSQFQPGIRAEFKTRNRGTDQLAGPKNLQTIALDPKYNDGLRVTLSLSIPHEHAPQNRLQLDDLPRKEITFEGEVEILTASLDDALSIDPAEEFTSQISNRILNYHPSSKKDHPDTIQSKVFRLPLLSVDLIYPNRFRYDDILVAMRHRETGQYFLLQNGSSSTRHGTFGEVQFSELQNPEENQLVNYYWKSKLQKQFPDFPDFTDWKKDADLLILPPEQFKTVSIPFKITVSVPDLDLLQQRLNESSE